jgi:kumamolisin
MARFAPSYRDAPKEACKVAEIDRSEPVELTLVLKPAKPPQPHAYTGKPLSRAEYNKAYASDPAAIERIRKFAAQHGMTVVQGDSPHQVKLRGTLGQAIDAFQPEAIGIYDGPHGRFRARAGHLSVPDDIAGDLVAVMGFDRRPVAKPHFRPRTGAGTSYTPPQVAERYGFPTNVTGAGQTIAIIELGGGYTDSEMAAYFNGLGIQRTGKLTAIGVDNASNAPGDPNGADGEVQLDIEVAGSVASGADLAVYFGPNEASGFLDAISAAINDQTNNPSVMSISWGGPESTYAQQDLQAYDLAFAHAATIGITVCVASGDNGASDGESSGKHVDFPGFRSDIMIPLPRARTCWAAGGRGCLRPGRKSRGTTDRRAVPQVAAIRPTSPSLTGRPATRSRIAVFRTWRAMPILRRAIKSPSTAGTR